MRRSKERKRMRRMPQLPPSFLRTRVSRTLPSPLHSPLPRRWMSWKMRIVRPVATTKRGLRLLLHQKGLWSLSGRSAPSASTRGKGMVSRIGAPVLREGWGRRSQYLDCSCGSSRWPSTWHGLQSWRRRSLVRPPADTTSPGPRVCFCVFLGCWCRRAYTRRRT
jgi:hypothetical protein